MQTVSIKYPHSVILGLLVFSIITVAQASVIGQRQKALSGPTQSSVVTNESVAVTAKRLTKVALVSANLTQEVSKASTTDTSGAITTDGQLKAIRDQVQIKLDQFRVAKGFPGATIGFVLPGGGSGSVSTGVSDLTTKRGLVPDDLMLAGSIGKTFVAATMLQLASEGKVNLDDKIERWFKAEPWFLKLPNSNDITVRTLLNHSSGIPNHADDEKFFKALAANPDRTWKPEDTLAFVLGKKALFAAGKGFSY